MLCRIGEAIGERSCARHEYRDKEMEPNYSNQNTTETKPDNLLVWSILVTVLCCWPLGIPAIINSTKVDKLWDSGDKAGAFDAAKKAKTFCFISLGLGILTFVILLISGVIAELADL